MSAPGAEERDRRNGARAVADDAPVFVISVAAQLAGMHAQTLRQYDRLGLVTPGRTPGGGRRYSPRDVALLREVQRLSQEDGVNLAGIKRIIDLESQVEALQQRVHELIGELEESERRRAASDAALHGSFAASYSRADLVPMRQATSALVVWRPRESR
ncbi:heat shock protein transcriptional repressor HspR [Geodermatophilus sp. SYSU D00814]